MYIQTYAWGRIVYENDFAVSRVYKQVSILKCCVSHAREGLKYGLISIFFPSQVNSLYGMCVCKRE